MSKNINIENFNVIFDIRSIKEQQLFIMAKLKRYLSLVIMILAVKAVIVLPKKKLKDLKNIFPQKLFIHSEKNPF